MPKILGMIGDGDPVQRAVLLEAQAVVQHDLAASGNPKQVVGGQS